MFRDEPVVCPVAKCRCVVVFALDDFWKAKQYKESMIVSHRTLLVEHLEDQFIVVHIKIPHPCPPPPGKLLPGKRIVVKRATTS